MLEISSKAAGALALFAAQEWSEGTFGLLLTCAVGVFFCFWGIRSGSRRISGALAALNILVFFSNGLANPPAALCAFVLLLFTGGLYRRYSRLFPFVVILNTVLSVVAGGFRYAETALAGAEAVYVPALTAASIAALPVCALVTWAMVRKRPVRFAIISASLYGAFMIFQALRAVPALSHSWVVPAVAAAAFFAVGAAVQNKAAKTMHLHDGSDDFLSAEASIHVLRREMVKRYRKKDYVKSHAAAAVLLYHGKELLSMWRDFHPEKATQYTREFLSDLSYCVVTAPLAVPTDGSLTYSAMYTSFMEIVRTPTKDREINSPAGDADSKCVSTLAALEVQLIWLRFSCDYVSMNINNLREMYNDTCKLMHLSDEVINTINPGKGIRRWHREIGRRLVEAGKFIQRL